MRQPTTTDRGIALMKFVLGLLGTKPEGMRPQDIYREVEAKVTLDEFDKEIMKGSGLPRWRAVLHFQSVAASKAGLLVKSDGQWHITDEGQKQAALAPTELK
jgi:restriction system protein